MDGNIELLNFVYQNSQMGVSTIDQLLKIVDDELFKKHLERQHQVYLEIHRDAKDKLHALHHDEKGLSMLEKVRTYLAINMQTMSNNSSKHVAEMMMVGSSMGIIDALKNIHKYQEANEDIIQLMERLLYFEEASFQQLKLFL